MVEWERGICGRGVEEQKSFSNRQPLRSPTCRIRPLIHASLLHDTAILGSLALEGNACPRLGMVTSTTNGH